MENAQLINLSRQVALQRQMDVVANNMANVNTTGFKAESILFDDYKMPVAQQFTRDYGSEPLEFTEDWATIHDLSAGAITDTGNPLDVALSGDGFFTVQTAGGERYTRSGAFQIDATGTLVDLSGNPVIGDSGPIHFDAQDTDITIGANGAIMTPTGSKGKLKIVEFSDAQALARDGDNLFSGGQPVAATNTRVVQGAIERSNVSGVAEMTEMIRVTRAYETLAGIMQKQDDIRHSAIQRLGSLNA